MCNLLTPYTGSVCRGVVDLNVESLVYIIDARPTLTATNVCSLVLQGECGAVDPSLSFTVNVNQGSPINAPKSVNAPRTPDELKIIHVSDIHYDPHYEAGSVAGGCVNPVCCRRGDGPAANPADGAGFWGDYRVS
jgi:sphingomyelin phosphodiesterase